MALIQPTRTESGHRLYSMADIEKVRSILGWIDRGVAVSKVGKILAKTEPLKALAKHHSERTRSGRLCPMAASGSGGGDGV